MKRGDVLCQRGSMMPVTQLFEAEMEVLDLLEYKPIISKGYTCVMHIHTLSEEIEIRDLISSEDNGEKGEIIIKERPQFVKTGQKVICRITSRNPVALEKFDQISQLGRFTLRDEGKTICVGKVRKYKPYKKEADEPATD